jgi:endonuclease/exonuclease/phosphatase family metal-dependent hydrolase
MSAMRTRLEYVRVAALLVRTWNVAHGRTFPETRETHLEEMVRLIAGDGPDVVCLQELPVWSLRELERWSGMRAFGCQTMPALGGPLARRVTAYDPCRLRSGLTGQANAILTGQALVPGGSGESIVLNPARFRRREARRLGLSYRARRHWAANRRVAHAVRVSGGFSSLVVLNMHLTGAQDSRLAEAELLRALTFANRVARVGEPLLVCGDLNLTRASSRLVDRLPRGGFGFSSPPAGIDHILGRGLVPVRGPEPWSNGRRRLGDVLLSDHAPVEAEMIRP